MALDASAKTPPAALPFLTAAGGNNRPLLDRRNAHFIVVSVAIRSVP
jgi:hypothetical protein